MYFMSQLDHKENMRPIIIFGLILFSMFCIIYLYKQLRVFKLT